MTIDFYIIDSSSLIHLNKHNPMDIYKGVWKKIEKLIQCNRLLAPKEVFHEIIQYDDTLAFWARTQKQMFVDPTTSQFNIVRDILKQFPSLIDIDRTYDADPWVIALAIELSASPQQTLHAIRRIVVTEEKLRGNRVRIPFVCEKFSIDSIDIIDMFRIEGWEF